MATENSDAIILKSVDFSETSLILTLLTQKFGKINGIAKGGRRLKNPFESALDLLACIRVSFLQKQGESLNLLTEAKLIRRFRPTAQNLPGLYAGYYVVELLNKTLDDHEPVPEIFNLTEQTISQLQTGERVPQTLLAFEWRLLEQLGLLPSLRDCAGCGEHLPLESVQSENKKIAFSAQEGGILCRRCREQVPAGYVYVTVPELRYIEYLLGITDGSSDTDSMFSEQTRNAVRGLLSNYICHVLGRRPKMHAYLPFIMRETENQKGQGCPDRSNISPT